MSGYNAPLCSDEELLEELRKLGYDEVAPEVFDIMKDDLADLVEKEHMPEPSANYDCLDNEYIYSPTLSHDSTEAFSLRHVSEKSKDAPEISSSRKTKSKSKREKSYSLRDFNINKSVSSDDGDYHSVSNGLEFNFNSSFEHTKEFNDESSNSKRSSSNSRNGVNKLKSKDNFRKSKNFNDFNSNDDTEYSSIFRSFSPEEKKIQSDLIRTPRNSHISRAKYRHDVSEDNELSSNIVKSRGLYRQTRYKKSLDDVSSANIVDAYEFKNDPHNVEEYLSPHQKTDDINLSVSESSVLSEKKTIKRKVLRRRNGRSVITEEIVEVPSIFDTSYLDSESFNNSKSFSSDDLSCKSNSSTGSVNVISPESSIKSSPSTFSLLTTQSTSLRVPNARKKKSDPVAMYKYYKKFWDNFKPPGENTHDRLRWAVRDKMLDYDL